MIHFTPKAQGPVLVDHAVALVADVLTVGLAFGVALATQRLVVVLHEADVGQLGGAVFALEALRVPVDRHRLDDASDDKLLASLAAWGVEDVKVAFAVLSATKLVVDAVLELAKALGTPETIKLRNLLRATPLLITTARCCFIEDQVN